MGTLLSVSRCQNHYKIDPNCTLTKNSSDVYTMIGGFSRDEPSFEGNPDIAGIGVLLAFFGVTSIALLWGFYIGFHHVKLQYDVGEYYDMPEFQAWFAKQKKLREDCYDFVMGCSDQLILTGIVYALTFLNRQACEISAYHYLIMEMSLTVACVSSMLAVVTTDNFKGNKFVILLRAAGLVTLYVLTSRIILVKRTSEELPFPDSNKDDTLILSAVCFLDAAEGNSGRVTTSTWSSACFIAVVVVTFLSVCANIVLQVFSREESLQVLAPKTLRDKILYALRVGSWILSYLTGLCVVIFLLFDIVRMRRWIDSSDWLQKENGANPESDTFALGQALPAVLFGLTLISAIRLAYEKFASYFAPLYPEGQEPVENTPTAPGSKQSLTVVRARTA